MLPAVRTVLTSPLAAAYGFFCFLLRFFSRLLVLTIVPHSVTDILLPRLLVVGSGLLGLPWVELVSSLWVEPEGRLPYPPKDNLFYFIISIQRVQTIFFLHLLVDLT